MGLFTSGKNNAAVATDKVWGKRQACVKGMTTEALLAIKRSEIPLIASFFEESHQYLIDFLTSLGVPFSVVRTVNDVIDLEGKNSIGVLLAKDHALMEGIHKQVKASIFIFGHYPVVNVEARLVETLATHFPGSPITYCLSLDDPLFEFFGAENIKSIMQTLGMKEDECIQHGMVSKSIRRAQEKLGGNLISDLGGSSEREWFQKNMKK